MFADCMLEASWAQRTRRSWITLTSFGLQVAAIGVLLIVPPLRTIGVPPARTVSTPITISRRPNPQPTQPSGHFHSSAVEIVPYTGRLMEPRRIPHWIFTNADAESTRPAIGVPGPSHVEFPFDLGSGIRLPMSGRRSGMPVAATRPKPAFRTSTMLQGSLIRRVEPVYPSLARTARVQGAVILDAVIAKDGTMGKLRLVSGHPLLAPAAIAAVSQWRYKPYILNGEAIEVETQITVTFVLAQN